jgi:hypothetical protein
MKEFDPLTDEYLEEKVWPNEAEDVKKRLAAQGWTYYRQARVREARDEHDGRLALSFRRPKK